MQIRWDTLSSTHPCYDEGRIRRMKLLYKGGYDLKEEAGLFLPKLHQESDPSYKERLSITALRPYLTKFINIYKSNLFSVELTVHAQQDEKDPTTAGDDTTQDEFYKLFLANCDGHRTSFHEFMKEKVYLPAEVCEYGYVGVDLPRATQSPANLAQEEEMGLDQPYLYQIDPCDVWDWEIDPETGKFLWVKLGYRIVDRPNAFSPWMHYWKVCNFYMKDGVRNYQVFKTPLYEDDKDPMDETLISLAEEGDTSFKEIGIFCLDLSEGQSLGYMLGPMVEEDYQMTSLESAYTTKACLTMPWVKLKNNMAGLSNSNKKSRGADPRGQFNAKGFIALNASDTEGDSIGIAETTGTALKFLHLQSEDRKEQLHEIVNQLHSASKQTSSKTGRSAAAMRESRYQMEITLSDRASQVWKLSRDIFTCISDSRGESFLWAPKGLCTETPPDPQDLQKAAQNLSKFNIGSDLADKKMRFKIATGILGKISSEEQEQIRRDINEAVERNDNVELYGPMFDAKLQQQINAKTSPNGQDNPTSTGGGNIKEDSKEDLVGESGYPTLPKGSFLQTGEHIDWQTPYNVLKDDYKKQDLDNWVPIVPWTGPVEVDISDIDFTGEEGWAANQPGTNGLDKVDEYAGIMKDKSFAAFNPVILAYMPHNDEKYEIIDGRHRVKAAQQAGLPVIAYVAHVGSIDPSTPHMQLHGKQKSKSSNTS